MLDVTGMFRIGLSTYECDLGYNIHSWQSNDWLSGRLQ